MCSLQSWWKSGHCGWAYCFSLDCVTASVITVGQKNMLFEARNLTRHQDFDLICIVRGCLCLDSRTFYSIALVNLLCLCFDQREHMSRTTFLIFSRFTQVLTWSFIWCITIVSRTCHHNHQQNTTVKHSDHLPRFCADRMMLLSVRCYGQRNPGP